MTPVPLRRNRDFLLLQTGQVLSTIGSESTAIAYPLLVLAVTHSPAKAGVVGFARILPWALFGFLAGLAADRLPRKRTMLVTDALRALATSTIVVAIALHALTFAQIAVVAFVEGSLFVFFNVAEFGALRSVVPTEQMPTAAAGEQVRYSVVQVAAPPLGGALYGLWRALPYLANAVSVVFSIGSLLAIRTRFEEEREPDTSPFAAQMAEGFRWLWAHPFLRTCALLFTWSNLVFEGLTLVLVVDARKHGLSAGAIGGLVAVLGASGVIGSLLSPRLQRLLSMRAIVVTSFWIQLDLWLFVAQPSVYVLLGALVPTMLFFPTLNSVVIGYRVALVPDALTGRVNSIARTLALCGAPFGPLIAGLLLGSTSPRVTVTAFAGAMVLLTAVASTNRAIRSAPSLGELSELSPGASRAAAG